MYNFQNTQKLSLNVSQTVVCYVYVFRRQNRVLLQKPEVPRPIYQGRGGRREEEVRGHVHCRQHRLLLQAHVERPVRKDRSLLLMELLKSVVPIGVVEGSPFGVE